MEDEIDLNLSEEDDNKSTIVEEHPMKRIKLEEFDDPREDTIKQAHIQVQDLGYELNYILTDEYIGLQIFAKEDTTKPVFFEHVAIRQSNILQSKVELIDKIPWKILQSTQQNSFSSDESTSLQQSNKIIIPKQIGMNEVVSKGILLYKTLIQSEPQFEIDKKHHKYALIIKPPKQRNKFFSNAFATKLEMKNVSFANFTEKQIRSELWKEFLVRKLNILIVEPIKKEEESSSAITNKQDSTTNRSKKSSTAPSSAYSILLEFIAQYYRSGFNGFYLNEEFQILKNAHLLCKMKLNLVNSFIQVECIDKNKKSAKSGAAQFILNELEKQGLYNNKTDEIDEWGNLKRLLANQKYALLPSSIRSPYYKLLLNKYYILKTEHALELQRRGFPYEIANRLLFRSVYSKELRNNCSVINYPLLYFDSEEQIPYDSLEEIEEGIQQWEEQIVKNKRRIESQEFDSHLPCIGPNGCSVTVTTGIFIPCYNANGEILSGQIKNDNPEPNNKKKYVWISSKSVGGNPPHLENGEVPIFVWNQYEVIYANVVEEPFDFWKRIPNQSKIVGLCEGGLKSIIAAYKLGLPVIGCAGGNFASSKETLLQNLQIINPSLLLFFPDAGSQQNPMVCLSYFRTFKILLQNGYDLYIVWWDQYDMDSCCDIDEIRKPNDAPNLRLLNCSEFFELVTEQVKQFLKRFFEDLESELFEFIFEKEYSKSS